MKSDPLDRLVTEISAPGKTAPGKFGADKVKNNGTTAQSFGEVFSSAAQSDRGSGSDGKLRELSKEFEAIFVNQMIKAMRSTIMKTGLISGGTGEEIFTEMLDMEYSRGITERSSLGLATKIYDQLSGKPIDRETVDTAADLGRNINTPGKI